MLHTPEFKLQVLDHYRSCGSIEQASKEFGVARQTLYNWLARQRTEGKEGLVDRSRAHRSHKHKTPPETVAQVRRLALQNPTLGGTGLAKLLVPPFIAVSPQTINAVLRQLHLATVDERWLALENEMRGRPEFGWTNTSAAIETFIASRNARYQDSRFRGLYPGEAVAIGVISLGRLSGAGNVYLSCAVDSFTCLAFGELSSSRSMIEPAGALSRALAVFAEFQWPVLRVKLHKRPFQTTRQLAIFDKFLDANGLKVGSLEDIESAAIFERMWLRNCKPDSVSSGLIIEFARSLKSDFFDKLDRRKIFSPEWLKKAFDEWLEMYNETQGISGYPSYGVSPAQAFRRAASEHKRLATEPQP